MYTFTLFLSVKNAPKMTQPQPQGRLINKRLLPIFICISTLSEQQPTAVVFPSDTINVP